MRSGLLNDTLQKRLKDKEIFFPAIRRVFKKVTVKQSLRTTRSVKATLAGRV